MAQVHSYLVTNAKLELKFLNEEITSEMLNDTFNQFALSMIDGSDLFEDNNDPEINFTFNDESNEIVNLEEINNNTLEINDLIDLSASILNTDIDLNEEEEEEEIVINHGDLDFDIDTMVNNFNIN